jgi:hypothetical protein
MSQHRSLKDSKAKARAKSKKPHIRESEKDYESIAQLIDSEPQNYSVEVINNPFVKVQ